MDFKEFYQSILELPEIESVVSIKTFDNEGTLLSASGDRRGWR
jgi:hypothetical protein